MSKYNFIKNYSSHVRSTKKNFTDFFFFFYFVTFTSKFYFLKKKNISTFYKIFYNFFSVFKLCVDLKFFIIIELEFSFTFKLKLFFIKK